MAVLTVGAGKQYGTVAAAVAASRDGDVVQVQAGTYTNDFAYVGTDITLQAVGGTVRMNATVSPSDGKAILTTNGDITINGFEFSGARVPDQNGAGIRQEGGNLTILNSYFNNNEMGILTAFDAPNATLTIRNSEFARNGTASGTAHNLYVNGIAKLEVDNSYFHDASVGHELKSRAFETVITNSRFADFNSTASYSIDLPNGGKAVLRNNVIEQGPNSQNPAIIAYGEEGNLKPGSLEMSGNTVINHQAGGLMLWNASGTAATVTDTDVFGLPSGNLVSGPANASGTTYLTSDPGFDTSSPWQGGGIATPPPPAPTPTPTPAPTPAPTPTPTPTPTAGQTLRGTAGGDALAGGAGNDAVYGGAGSDNLTGGAGADTLHGGTEADRLTGGAGNDLLIGARGSDTFIFGSDFGRDTVQGFTSHGTRGSTDRDHLDLTSLGVTGANFAAEVKIAQQGAHVLISIAGEGEILVLNKSVSAFDASDFILG